MDDMQGVVGLQPATLKMDMGHYKDLPVMDYNIMVGCDTIKMDNLGSAVLTGDTPSRTGKGRLLLGNNIFISITRIDGIMQCYLDNKQLMWNSMNLNATSFMN